MLLNGRIILCLPNMVTRNMQICAYSLTLILLATFVHMNINRFAHNKVC